MMHAASSKAVMRADLQKLAADWVVAIASAIGQLSGGCLVPSFSRAVRCRALC